MTQRPSRAFPAKYPGGCTGCGGDVAEGDMIRMHYGLAYHDDPDCLPEISAWGERRPAGGSGADVPHDPWD